MVNDQFENEVRFVVGAYLSSPINVQLPFGVLYRLDQVVTFDINVDGVKPEVLGAGLASEAAYTVPDVSDRAVIGAVPEDPMVTSVNTIPLVLLPPPLSRLIIFPFGAFRLNI